MARPAIERDDENEHLWPWLRRGLGRFVGRAHVHRIEDLTKSGTPDVEGCIGGVSFWIELKVAYEQVREPVVRVKTTDKQVYFAMRRCEVGGLSWYLVRVGAGRRALHYLVHGSEAEALLDRPVPVAWLAERSRCPPDAAAWQVLSRASLAV